MGTELDDKLDSILYMAVKSYQMTSDREFLLKYSAQIKQAFTDAGYVRVPVVTEVRNMNPDTTWELSDKKLTVNGKEVMTGQEWYDRFAALIKYHGFYENVTRDFVHEAAKKAAGLHE